VRLGQVLDGTFEVSLGPWPDGVEHWLVIGELGGGGCSSWARALVPTPTGGSVTMGTLRLEPAPLIASGIVVGPDGNPVGGVELTFAEGKQLEYVNDRPRARSDWDGSFELRGWCGPSAHLIGRWRRAYHELARVPRGSTNLVLDAPLASLRGRVLMDPGVAPDDFDLHLRSRVPGWGERLYIQFDGTFVNQALEPGPVRLTASPDGDPSVEIWEEDFELAVGERRELVIDLRGSVHFVDFTVVDEAGAPIEYAIVHPASENAGFGESDPTRDDGRARILLTDQARPIDVLVQAIGYRITAVSGATDETTVVLESSLPVRLVVEGAPRLSPSLYRLGVYAVSLDVPLGGFCRASGECRLDGPAELDLDMGIPGTGRWNLRWSLKHRDGATWSALLLTTEPEVIEVRERETEQVFRVAAPTLAIERAVARLEGR